MEMVLQEIERALNCGLYYLALVMTLTLPDLCAALESPNGASSGVRYRAWYDANLAARYTTLTADDCYNLRCGVVHQGRLGHPHLQYGRVLFTVPNAQRNVFHNNIMNDALNLDTILFCGDVIDSVRRWFATAQGTHNVQTNLPHLVQYRATGLAPYMVGIPLIA